MKLIFWVYINIKVFCKLILPILVGMGTISQVANQIADALEGHSIWKYFMDCLDFLHVLGPSSKLLKVFSILVGCFEVGQKYPRHLLVE